MEKTRRGFTLIELLIVVTIIGLLASIVLVALSNARTKGKIAAIVQFQANMYHAMGSNSVLYLPIEDCGSGQVRDFSVQGNFNNGTINTGVTYSTTDTPYATSKCSLSFDGSAGVSFANPLGLSNRNFTVAAWIKTSSASTRMYVIAGEQVNTGYGFGLNAGTIGFTIGNSNGSFTESTCGPSGLNDGTWHHIVGVFDRTNLQFICFLDGKQVGTTAIASNYPNMPEYAPIVGKPPYSTAYVGLIDDIDVYAQNLNGVSIRELYESEKGNFLAAKI